jgi:amino acid transporter
MSNRSSPNSEQELADDAVPADESSFLLGGDSAKKLGVWGLTVITFFNVSGGPIGFEDTVRWGGPFNVLVALCVVPIIFTLPMGLICAELASAFPFDSGHTAWLQTAFGGKWGFYEGWLTWSAGSIDNSLYAGMCINIFHRAYPHAFPALFASSSTILLLRLLISLLLAFVPFLSVHWVSRFSAVSSVAVLFPVVLFVIVLLPQVNPSNWIMGPPKPMDFETWCGASRPAPRHCVAIHILPRLKRCAPF